MEALVGDDVLAIDQERWQAMARSPSPHRRDDALADHCGQWRGTGVET